MTEQIIGEMANGREKLKYLKNKLLQCHSVHHKSHMNCPGTEPEPLG
jgi:hypothetical protein